MSSRAVARRLAAPSLALLLLLGLGAPGVAQAGVGDTVVVDRPTGLGAPSAGVGNNADLDDHAQDRGAVSGDAGGRWVVFASSADSLLATPTDDGGGEHIYELDRQTGLVRLVSVDAVGAPVDGLAPSVSADGTRVAFTTHAPIDAAHDPFGESVDVYVRDLTSGTTQLVTRGTGSGSAAAGGTDGTIDAAGDKVAFETRAGLDPADPSGSHADVYVRDLATSTTTLVSRVSGAGGAPGNGDSTQPALNADGTVVAFASSATNLDPADDANGSSSDVFVRSGTTTNLASSRSTLTTGGNDDSYDPDLSPSGNTIAFTSQATNLVAGAGSGDREVYRRQQSVAGSPTILVSKAAGGAPADGDATLPSIAVVGSKVVTSFSSTATNLDPALTTENSAIYLDDDGVKLVSRGAGSTGAPEDEAIAGSSTGAASEVVAYAAYDVPGTPGRDFSHVAVRDMGDPAQPLTTVDHAPGSPDAFADGLASGELDDADRAVSANGRYVVFVSGADSLAGAPDEESHVFRRDLLTGETILVDRHDGAAGAPTSNGASNPVVSADGNVVAFLTEDGLEPGAPGDGSTQVHVRDIAAGTTRLASRADGASGAADERFPRHPSISGDGHRVAWDTEATNLGTVDGNPYVDVYVRDLVTHRTLLASRADGAGAPVGDGRSEDPSLDFDGNVVAFDSSSTNFGDGDGTSSSDVHVRDLAAGTTRLVSQVPTSDAPSGGADDESQSPSTSADGTRVAFSSKATNLVPGDSDGVRDVFVRDLKTATTVLASRADGASGALADEASDQPALSADGTTVAFSSLATNLTQSAVPGPTANVREVYVRELSTAATTLVSRADGPAGAPADKASPLASGAPDPQISADGGCVAFVSSARSLAAAAGVSSDFARVYERTLHGSCPPSAPAGNPAPASQGQPAAAGKPASSAGHPNAARAPSLRVRLTHTRFRARRVGRRAAGTTFVATLSAPATITYTVGRLVPGRLKAKHCRAATSHSAHGRPCTFVRKAGSLTVKGKAGTTRTTFTARLAGHRLAPGRYRLTARARNAAGASVPRTVTFTVLR